MSWFLWAAILALVALFILLARKNGKQAADYWTARGFPTFDTATVLGNPILGLLRPKSIMELDRLLYGKVKHGMKAPYAGVTMFGMHSLIVTDLEFAKRVFVKDADHFLARLQISVMKDTDPLFASMLFFMEGEPWKELRSKMSPTFTTGKIKRMFHVFESSSTKLVSYLGKEVQDSVGGKLDLFDTYGRYTMDVIASAAFGIDARTFAEKDPIFPRMGKKVQLELSFGVMIKFLLMIYTPKIAKAFGISFIPKDMEAFFTKVILDAVKHRGATGERREDFLQLMLDARSGQLKDDEGKSVAAGGVDLSDDVLIAQSVLFILAGFETTQTLLVFTVYALASNPDVQVRLREELDKSWKANEGTFSYESVNGLEYLDKVVNETLRMYPPVTRMERNTMFDYTIPDTEPALVVPKGTQVVIPTIYIHHDEEFYPNPEVFDPERFSPEQKNARHPIAFQPFGHGPRNCIGMRFALTNAKTAIANLVREFHFEPSEATLIPMQYETTNFLKPKGGMHLKVTKRVM